jgi:hypothetical protein
MPHRAFCCNDTPPKGLVLGMGGIAVLLGLAIAALGSGVLPAVAEWVAAPKWLLVGVGVTIALGGIVIPLSTLPAMRRSRATQH